MVKGRVALVKAPRDGDISGVIGVEFVSLQPPGGGAKDILGKLTSLRQDDRRRMVELAPKVSTGRHIDVVFIGRSTAGHASTLVGDDLAEAWSHLGAATRYAIIRFQLDQEQVATGDLDGETLRLLGLPPPSRP